MKRWVATALIGCLTVAVVRVEAAVDAPAAASFDLSAIDRVWSGHSVPFGLAVTDQSIVVAYYDAARQMTVASRPRDADWWTYHKVESWTNWDSHNGIAVAVDDAGHIHVVGNMHNDPLVYFRTEAAGDVRTLRRLPVMANADLERRMTYPVFLRDGQGRLLFKYRDGGSGSGNEVYNALDAASQTWRALLDAPLVDGEGQRNAYFVGPVLGPDGLFHLTWVWRDTPDAATNHDLSYARSRDLVHWTKSDGTPLPLPITFSNAEIVDPVPVRQGMINNNTMIGFDQAGRAMIAYHKFDAEGRTQVYVARRDEEGWSIHQASDWSDFRWDFGGMGSLHSRLTLQSPVAVGSDRIRVRVVRDGKAADLILDTAKLRRIEERPAETLGDRLARRIRFPEGMQLNAVQDRSGIAIAWPALPPRRDEPGNAIPDPTVLYLVEPGQ